MRQLIRNFAKETRRHEFFWRYGSNFFPSLNYKFGQANNTSRITHRALEKLNRDGIYITSIEEFFEARNDFAALEESVKRILANRNDELQKLKAQANDAQRIGEKTFNVELLGNPVEFHADSIFAKFALENVFLDIANAYFGMLVKMRYYNVWLTFATDGAARESQLWHYDREDNYILKVFLYLKDVDEGTGPFTYAPQTHPKGALYGREPEFFMEKNIRRTTDAQMAAIVSSDKWIKAVGKKGTIVFADTRGYHKGGEARTSDRLMFTCMYTSPASGSKKLLNFSSSIPFFGLSQKQISALELR